MPGFGAADKPEHFDYSVPGYARHLGKLLAAQGVRRAQLVMHDFGGPWGLAWAASHPRVVASVTCINTGVLSGYRWHYLARIWQTPVLGELFMASTTKTGMRLLLRHGNPRGLPPQYFDHVYRTFDRGTKRAVLRLYRNTRDTEEGARQLTTAYLVGWRAVFWLNVLLMLGAIAGLATAGSAATRGDGAKLTNVVKAF